jgi:iron complex outermembrane receptor protein
MNFKEHIIMKRTFISGLLLSVGLTIFALFSFAQAEEEGRLRNTNVTDITVTAQKIEESVQDVPISTTVFNEYAIQDLQIEKIEDIAAYTPNLFMFGYGSDGSLSSSIRGVYTDIMSPTVPVGIYVDGVPVSNGHSMNVLINNIERIEVLKGPQGTLYGKNTEAGVINIITKQPGNEFEGKIDLEIGEDNKKQYNVNIQTPIVKDKLFASISGLHYEKDGMMTDSVTGETLDDREHNSGKLALRFTPNDDLDVSFINSYTKRNDDAQKLSLITQSKDDVSLDFDSYDKSETLDSSLKVKYDFSATSYIESVTARKVFKNNNAKDWDCGGAGYSFHVKFDGDTETTLLEELRYHQKLYNDRIDLLLGLFVQDYEHNNRYVQTRAMGGMSMVSDVKDDYNDRSYGVFTHIIYGLTDSLKILGGVRYDHEKKEYDNLVDDILMDKNFDAVSPKLSFEYDLKDNIMAYATMAKGYPPVSG